MELAFIGIDPNTGQTGSATVWVDPDNADLVFQGDKADPETKEACIENTAPGHAKGIPAHETVIRIPVHMVPFIREACDAAERAQLR